MLNSFHSFRISLREAFILLTGLCLSLALLTYADFAVVGFARAILAVILVFALAVALALPKRREVLFSFVGGTIIILVYDYSTSRALHRMAVLFASGNQNLNVWSDPQFNAAGDLFTVELAVGMGLLSAWIARSLQNRGAADAEYERV